MPPKATSPSPGPSASTSTAAPKTAKKATSTTKASTAKGKAPKKRKSTEAGSGDEFNETDEDEDNDGGGKKTKSKGAKKVALGISTSSEQEIIAGFWDGKGSLEGATASTVYSMIGAKHVGIMEKRLELDTKVHNSNKSEQVLRYRCAMLKTMEVESLIDNTSAVRGTPPTEQQLDMSRKARECYTSLEKELSQLLEEA